MDKIALKTHNFIIVMKTELVEISYLPRVWIHCSFRMQECRDDTEINNYQRIQLSNNTLMMESCGYA